MVLTFREIDAFEILDSRGRPTLAVRVTLSDGTSAVAKVPSGASTGRHEAAELRDGDAKRFRGKGVLRAVAGVRGELAQALEGTDAEDQATVDRRMIELDGTPNKSRLGANAILGVSCATARAVAFARHQPLWRRLAGGRDPSLPVPMVNILSGGLHAGRNIEFQDFLAIPHGLPSYAESLRAAAEIHAAAADILERRGYRLSGVADEGGWGPSLRGNEEALQVLLEAIETSGYQTPDEVSIAIDVASSHFYRSGEYRLLSEGRTLDSVAMIDLLDEWCRKYPILSVEDGLEEDDWGGWQRLTRRLGGRLQLLGDDLFTTNPARVREGIERKAANAVLVKMNQIGTLTETFEVIDLARENGWTAVISARSGETEDDFLADLAVASGMGQIKVGSVTRSERLAKYNRLLELEREGSLPWPGSQVFARFARTCPPKRG
jgi:enolase